MSRSLRLHLLLWPALLACFTLACELPVVGAAGTAAGDDGGRRSSATAVGGSTALSGDWKRLEELVSEQKFQEAADLAALLRQRAEETGEAEVWTRALIREVQLRTALHGYENTVRLLREAAWPEAPRSRAVLHLFYAHGLVTYAGVYSWEIGQRERVAGEGVEDLAKWTLDQIVAEAQRAFLEAWKGRASWGGESLGPLAEYLEQNNYPARIRGTLRDAVTYLWVELLADSSLWSPAQSNAVYRLDLAALIAGHEGAVDEGLLADPELHPLQKLDLVLSDLEAWHRRERRPEAAFEARLERLRRLHQAFDQKDDRQAIRVALEGELEDFNRGLDWWSMGMAELADLLSLEDVPDALVRAREVALEGAEAHPESLGGRRCRHIVASIEAPAYSVRSMASDGPHRRSILVNHKNLDRLWFRAYALDLIEEIESSEDYGLLPDHREVPEIVDRRSPSAEWKVDLPPTPDYRSHDTYVTPPFVQPGLYLIVASARRDFARERNELHGFHMILTDLVLVTRREPSAIEVTVRSGRSGRPARGVRVLLYRRDYRRGHRVVDSRNTLADGRVRFPMGGQGRRSHFLVAQRGEEVALDEARVGPRGEMRRDERRATLIYTDRSVYRPQQEILWKAVAYEGESDEGRFETLPGQELEIRLVDAGGETVETRAVKTNAFGSVSGSFQIPAGRLLGAWSLRSSLAGRAAIRVEEYKRPTFEVELEEPEEILRLNRTARLRGAARYYFGLPVAVGEVTWRVTREPVYPIWWFWFWPPPSVAPETLAAGRTELSDEGGFELEFLPAADERLADQEGVTYNFRLSVDVTDEGGETRSASRAFRLGFVAVEGRIESERAFLVADEAVELSVLRTDLDGQPRAGRGSWRLVELVQPEEVLLPADLPRPAPPEGTEEGYRTPGDLLRPRWESEVSPESILRQWSEGREVLSGEFEHGEDGRAPLTLEGLPAGAYRLLYETRDPWDAAYETSRDLLVVERGAARIALPALLQIERESVPVGETARLLVHSGLEQQEMVLEILSSGVRRERRVLASEASPHLVEIPVEEIHRGGFGIRLTALRDHQLMAFEGTVMVPWDDRELQVEFASFRDLLRPGALETWRVRVRAADEGLLERQAAELLAYMYDRSLDLFAPHVPPAPLSLYPFRGQTERVRTNLGTASSAWSHWQDFQDLPESPQLRADRLKFFDSYGIGGPGRRRFRMPRMVGGKVPMPATMEFVAESRMAADVTEGEPLAVGGEGPAEEAVEEPAELREDFAETAFWEPHLRLDADGAVAFEFTVPDSVTEWSVWVHALTRDLRSGSLERRTRSVKELMVRPYLPRFLREGDRADLRVVVNNAGETELAGDLELKILDPESGESLLAEFGLEPDEAGGRPFRIEPGGSAALTFPLRAPRRVGTVSFEVVGRAGDWSDGERRPLPLLPGRFHLAQSRFVALQDAARRELSFPDLAAADDPSRIHEQLVVTLDAQLFYGVLRALPYLVNYPYECTEQMLNRFLSTGIVSSLYERYPAVGRMAKRFAERETRWETWDAVDPNRKMALEETPWLALAGGGRLEEGEDLINVLDPRIAGAQRTASLAKLRKAQLPSGAFPWWPGGPPSPYITLYILNGLSRALEFEIEVPREMVVRGWDYLRGHYVDDLVRESIGRDCCWEMVTFLNYVLSNYPEESWTGGVFDEADRRRMLDFSFKHWKQHTPLLKGYLALTLERAGRAEEARLVFDSIMDSARSDPDLGTYWAPEERAWLWYNDTIETHAFALRALSELEPDDARRHGLVQWLFLNKKLNHWKSTRATAEVVYSLVHYLDREGSLAAREEAEVTVGPRSRVFVFEPDRYGPLPPEGEAGPALGRPNQLVVPGAEIDPASMSTIVVEKATPGFMFASATWHFSTEKLPEEARGDLFSVTRRFFRRVNTGREWILRPLEEGASLAPGDQVEVQLTVRAKHAAEYVHLRDPRAAGFEPETTTSRYRWDLGIGAYEEIRDSGTNFFFEWLPAGEYTLKYRLRANLSGAFQAAPATLQSMYAPEFTAYSSGRRLVIGE